MLKLGGHTGHCGPGWGDGARHDGDHILREGEGAGGQGHRIIVSCREV